jgi:hypothetical protein
MISLLIYMVGLVLVLVLVGWRIMRCEHCGHVGGLFGWHHWWCRERPINGGDTYWEIHHRDREDT